MPQCNSRTRLTKHDTVIIKQGWCESNNNEMCFYLFRFNIPRIVQQLSDCTDIIIKKSNGNRLNPMAEPHGCDDNVDFNKCKIKEERHSMKDVNNDKVKEHDWKTVEKKRTNGKRTPEFVITRNKNKCKVLQDDNDEGK